MVTLNRIVAVAMVQGPRVALNELHTAEGDPALAGHHRVEAIGAHLLDLAGDTAAARVAFERAARRTQSVPERRYLESRAEGERKSNKPGLPVNPHDGVVTVWRPAACRALCLRPGSHIRSLCPGAPVGSNLRSAQTQPSRGMSRAVTTGATPRGRRVRCRGVRRSPHHHAPGGGGHDFSSRAGHGLGSGAAPLPARLSRSSSGRCSWAL